MVSCGKLKNKLNKMDKELKELLKRAFNEGVMYEATLSSACSFKNFIEELELEQLTIPVVSHRRGLLFCDFCKEENPHKKHEHKKLKECEGCGLITKL